jgi:hypothetical protein
MEMQMQCPHCSGKGGVDAFVNRGPDISTHSVEWLRCLTCNGDGSVSGATAGRIARGEDMRKARLARGETILEASRRLGIGPAALSAAEHGRASPEAEAALSKMVN